MNVLKGPFKQSSPQMLRELRGQRMRQASPACQFKEFNRELWYWKPFRTLASWIDPYSLRPPPDSVFYSYQQWECVDDQRDQVLEGSGARARNICGAYPSERIHGNPVISPELCAHIPELNPGIAEGVKDPGSPRCQDGKLAWRWSHLWSAHWGRRYLHKPQNTF